MTEFANFLIIAGTLALMLVGFAGTLLPALPGLALMWLGALAYGIFSGFNTWGVVLFIFITVLAFVGEVAAQFLVQAGAARTGASGWAILASVVLGFIGMFVIPVIGALIGAMLGVLLVEYYRRRNWREAWQATTGTLWGYGLSFTVQAIIGVMIFVLWGIWLFVG